MREGGNMRITDEVTTHLLDTPQELHECIEKKRLKPGRLN